MQTLLLSDIVFPQTPFKLQASGASQSVHCKYRRVEKLGLSFCSPRSYANQNVSASLSTILIPQYHCAQIEIEERVTTHIVSVSPRPSILYCDVGLFQLITVRKPPAVFCNETINQRNYSEQNLNVFPLMMSFPQ